MNDAATFLEEDRHRKDNSRRELRDLAVEFQLRAKHFGKLAYVSEFLVAICIFGGIYVFWYSDQILLQIQEARLDSLERERAYEQDRIVRERQSIDTNRIEIAALEKAIESDKLKGRPTLSAARPDSGSRLPPGLVDQEIRLSPNETRLSDLKNSIARSERQIESSDKNLLSIDKRRAELRSTPESQVAIALATKAGAVLLLLFFVRVLVSIFRYYSRLSTFYLARADAMQYYTSAKPQTLNEFATLVFPASVEFEKGPETPDLPSVSVVKEAMAARTKP